MSCDSVMLRAMFAKMMFLALASVIQRQVGKRKANHGGAILCVTLGTKRMNIDRKIFLSILSLQKSEGEIKGKRHVDFKGNLKCTVLITHHIQIIGT